MRKSILITGISGFVGSNLAIKLLKEYPDTNIYGIIRNKDSHKYKQIYKPEVFDNINIVYGDITDSFLMEKTIVENEIDAIVNLASQAIVRICNEFPISALMTNVVGSAIIQDIVRRHPQVKHLEQFTSDKSYGTSLKLPYKEDETPLKGMHPYESTKALIDMWSQMYQVNYDVPISIIRSANIFGEGDSNFSRLVPQVCTSISKNKNPWLWESVSNYVREFIYIDDVTDFIIHLLNEGETNPNVIKESYNLGSGNVFSIKDFVERIIKVTGKDLDVIVKEKEFDFEEIKEQYLSLAKTKTLLRWEAKYNNDKLDEALLNTYNYYNNLG